ncbi:MAG: low molecular weight phosphotyrosine protein phosphatase [Rickettsiales bacterium]|jgi:protein-tyrosine phosphatase|nr:low molecular weight phosphotyrosine protein phosphatase [Rickettsiales bacterium]
MFPPAPLRITKSNMMRLGFVCTGNICRSPTAEGIARHLIHKNGLNIDVQSAGTHGYHIGEPPDRRSIITAKKYGVDIASQRARLISPSDFHDSDLLLAMDGGHLRLLHQLNPVQSRAEIALFMDYAGMGMQGVPDPYYGNLQGFDDVYKLIESAMQTILDRLKNCHAG